MPPGHANAAWPARCRWPTACRCCWRCAVAAAHAGWRGLSGGVLEATLAALCQGSGSAAADVVVWLGPCIGKRRFEVDADVLAAFSVSAKTTFGTIAEATFSTNAKAASSADADAGDLLQRCASCSRTGSILPSPPASRDCTTKRRSIQMGLVKVFNSFSSRCIRCGGRRVVHAMRGNRATVPNIQNLCSHPPPSPLDLEGYSGEAP